MKNRLLKSTFFAVLLFAFLQFSYGQVPQGLNYMAIARDGDMKILPEVDLQVRVAILRTFDPPDIEWEEEHKVHTNETGLFRLTIGDKEAKPIDGHATSFAEIDWTIQPLYIRTSIYINDVWESTGEAEILSVPYAMMAGKAYGGVGNPFSMVNDTILFTNSIDVVGDDLAMDEAIFEVKRNDGVTMFAVYNQGVRINVPLIDAVKGVKGGFAISGFSGSKATSFTNLFTLNKDSARIYVDKTPDLTKGAKGGFAVGGFDLVGKAGIQEYLSITPDSARIFVKDAAKGAKGGFAVSGFGAKAAPVNFLNITPDNYFIGHESGLKIQPTGLYNSVIGYQAGKSLTTGNYNTILGYLAGTSVAGGNENIVIGKEAGKNLSSGNHNTIIGNSAGYNHTSQQYNIMIGTNAGFNTQGSYNSFIGINAGYKISTGINNVFLGTNAGAMIENGYGNTIIGIDAGRSGEWDPYTPHGYYASDNTIIGNNAGYSLDQGNNNVLIGAMTGSSLINSSGNVFLGYTAGSEETGSNKLYITNETRDGDDNPVTPLVFGDFSIHKLGINTTTLTKTINVGGDALITGNLTAGSITAPLNGTVTGSLIGNVSGNLTGNVNGMKMGRISLSESGTVEFTAGFFLDWKAGDGILTIINSGETFPCHFWFKSINKGTMTDGAGVVEPKSELVIISQVNFDGNSFEVHFGEGEEGFCSVWIQYFNGKLSGHYMKY